MANRAKLVQGARMAYKDGHSRETIASQLKNIGTDDSEIEAVLSYVDDNDISQRVNMALSENIPMEEIASKLSFNGLNPVVYFPKNKPQSTSAVPSPVIQSQVQPQAPSILQAATQPIAQMANAIIPSPLSSLATPQASKSPVVAQGGLLTPDLVKMAVDATKSMASNVPQPSPYTPTPIIPQISKDVVFNKPELITRPLTPSALTKIQPAEEVQLSKELQDIQEPAQEFALKSASPVASLFNAITAPLGGASPDTVKGLWRQVGDDFSNFPVEDWQNIANIGLAAAGGIQGVRGILQTMQYNKAINKEIAYENLVKTTAEKLMEKGAEPAQAYKIANIGIEKVMAETPGGYNVATSKSLEKAAKEVKGGASFVKTTEVPLAAEPVPATAKPVAPVIPELPPAVTPKITKPQPIAEQIKPLTPEVKKIESVATTPEVVVPETTLKRQDIVAEAKKLAQQATENYTIDKENHIFTKIDGMIKITPDLKENLKGEYFAIPSSIRRKVFSSVSGSPLDEVAQRLKMTESQLLTSIEKAPRLVKPSSNYAKYIPEAKDSLMSAREQMSMEPKPKEIVPQEPVYDAIAPENATADVSFDFGANIKKPEQSVIPDIPAPTMPPTKIKIPPKQVPTEKSLEGMVPPKVEQPTMIEPDLMPAQKNPIQIKLMKEAGLDKNVLPEFIKKYGHKLSLYSAQVYRKVISFEDAVRNVKNDLLEMGNIKVPSGNAAADFFLEDMPTPPEVTRKIVEMPEMVEIANTIGTDLKISAKLGRALGRAIGDPATGKTKIKLLMDIFKEPRKAATVFAHELGHVADYLPDIMKRGNILGRIASLTKYLKDTHPLIPRASSKEITQELKDLTQWWHPFDDKANPNYTKYRYKSSELYADAISVLFNDPDALKSRAPMFWENFNNLLDRKPEFNDIYNDIQARLNMPREEILKAREKRDVEAFQKGYEKKIQVQKEGDKVPYQLSTAESIVSGLIRKSYPIGKEFERIREAKGLPVESNPQLAFESLPYIGGTTAEYMRDIYSNVYGKLKETGLNNDDLALYLKHNNIINSVEVMRLEDFKAEIPKYQKYIDNNQVKIDIDPVTGQEYVIVSKEIARPGGFDIASSKEQLDFMKKRLGSKYDNLEELANNFYSANKKLMDYISENTGFFSPDQKMTIANNPTYATTQILDYISKYISPNFVKQIGSLKEQADPGLATMEKMASIVYASLRSEARKSFADVFLGTDAFGGTIRKAEKVFDGRKMVFKKPENGMELLVYRDEGKTEAIVVPSEIANIYATAGSDILSSISQPIFKKMIDVNTKANEIFKALVTTYNPKFPLKNLLRDFEQVVKADPDTILLPVALAKAIAGYVKASPEAFKLAFKGQSSPALRYMAKIHAIDPSVFGYMYNEDISPNEIIAEEFSKYGISAEDLRDLPTVEIWNKMIGNTVKGSKKARALFKNIGIFSEILPKLVGFNALSKKDMSPKMLAYYIRNYYGSPDFRVTPGLQKIIKQAFTFSNPLTQDIRRSYELATATGKKAEKWTPPTLEDGEYTQKRVENEFTKTPANKLGYALSTLGLGAFTAITGYLTEKGIFGEDAAKDSKGITRFNKINNIVMTLGKDSSGKSIYMRLPLNETDRIAHALTYNMLEYLDGQGVDLKDLITNFMGIGSQMFPSISPSLEVGSAWSAYLSGNNPLDLFRGRGVLTKNEEQVLKSGDKLYPHNLYRMADYSLNKFGFPYLAGAIETLGGPTSYENIFKKLKPQVKSDIDELLQYTPFLAGIIGTSDYGVKEKKIKTMRERFSEKAKKAIERKELQRKNIK